MRAASIIFFAYVGFEAVSTAAGEARNPQKDLPVGILGSLVICTVIYMAVAAVMTGVVPFRELAGGATDRDRDRSHGSGLGASFRGRCPIPARSTCSRSS